MLIRAGEALPKLFKDYRAEPELKRSVIRKAESIALVRQRRDDQDQEIAFGARPFILCGLPIRSLPPGVTKYSRRNGRFFLEIVGHPEFGVPFGQDRLILLWIATLAVRQKNPVVEFRSASEILYEFGMPANGVHYRKLSEGFKRVFGSSIFFGTEEERNGSEVWNCGRTHFFDEMRLWNRQDGAARGPNLIALSDRFWREIREHPIPVDREVVRALASNPGCLDLYTWLTWRCFQAKDTQRVPLSGPFGLANQLGVQEYRRERKFRERVRLWLDIVRQYWPQCPARVAKNGAFLEVEFGSAIRSVAS